MVELQINTTQNVKIIFTAASVGERILAYGIDWLIKIAYAIVTYLVIFKVFGIDSVLNGMDDWSRIAVMLLFYLPAIFYTLIFEAILDGQTPGKRVLKIKVVKIDGYQASLADFVMRWFFRIIDVNTNMGIVALVSIISSSKSQRLGDMGAGTSVITLRNKINMSHTILEDLESTYVPTYPSVINLSDNDMRIIKDTFIVAKKSKDYETLIKLRTKIMSVMDIKEKQGSDMEFIDTVLKDYNYYTQNM
ncbi:MAG: RDD family protein [Bacteroidetes bacterium MedPE-SWsnd-G2]|nr:MAG: RDD family protein [Bacteroidetes bacterium MedPE-SWsnd-G2]